MVFPEKHFLLTSAMKKLDVTVYIFPTDRCLELLSETELKDFYEDNALTLFSFFYSFLPSTTFFHLVEGLFEKYPWHTYPQDIEIVISRLKADRSWSVHPRYKMKDLYKQNIQLESFLLQKNAITIREKEFEEPVEDGKLKEEGRELAKFLLQILDSPTMERFVEECIHRSRNFFTIESKILIDAVRENYLFEVEKFSHKEYLEHLDFFGWRRVNEEV